MKKPILLLAGTITGLCILCMLAAGCDQDKETVPASYSIGGTITGISGSETSISLNGTNTLTLDSNGSFVFDHKLSTGTNYEVTVSSQPSGSLYCTVTNGAGTIETDNVDNVLVSCSSSESIWSISGAETVLEGNIATYTIQLSGDTLAPGETATIKVNTSESVIMSAEAGTDYVSLTDSTLTITGPTTSASVEVQTIADSIAEPNEYFEVHLCEPSIGVISPSDSRAVTVIINN